MLQTDLKRVPKVHNFIKHVTDKYLTTSPNTEAVEEVRLQNLITLLPLVTKLLLEIVNKSVQAPIFTIVKICDKDTVKYIINAEEPKAPSKRAKFRSRKKGRPNIAKKSEKDKKEVADDGDSSEKGKKIIKMKNEPPNKYL